ncbi:MAG: hypothetical protein Q7S68_06070, partial [Deltaproteobacteria bacterium]|nr:hypothetical protein [Deltaproteobacteria bacterium]
MERLKKSAWLGWSGLIIFGLAITYLTSFTVSNLPEKVEVGMVIRSDIRADRRLTIVNEEETKVDQETAAASVLPVFDYDEKISDEVPTKLHRFLSKPIVADTSVLSSYAKTGV